MALGSLANQFDNRLALDFRGSSVLNQSYPVGGYAATVAFTPLSLFAAGEQGVWYDPSDLTTMFEDSTGYTAVHTPGNGTADSPVGLLLDKHSNGVGTNGAARYNLLTYTEDFTNEVWTKNNVSVSANSTSAPDGTLTADSLIENTANTPHYITVTGIGSSSSISTFSVAFKANTRTAIRLYWVESGAAGYIYCDFNLSTGQIYGSATAVGTATSASASISSLGNGWYRCSVSGKAGTGNTTCYGQFNLLNQLPAPAGDAYVGDGTSGIYIWGADLRLTSQTALTPTYQPITSSWAATMAGNHATQSTSTARPTLSAKYNLLTYTEDFTNGVWSKNVVSVTGGQSDPLGGTTASLITNSITGISIGIYYTIALSAGQTFTIHAKKGNVDYLSLSGNAGGSVWAYYNLANGTIGNSGNCTPTMTSVGNGWYRCSMTNSTASTNYLIVLAKTANGTASGWNNTDSVPSGSTIYLWGADIRVTNDGVNLPAYQRVVDANTYDSVGFPYYLKADGVDDYLQTASTVNMTSTKALSAFSGFRKTAAATSRCQIYGFGGKATFAGDLDFYVPFSSSLYQPELIGDINNYLLGASTTLVDNSTKVTTIVGNFLGATNTDKLSLRLNTSLESLTYTSVGNVATFSFGNRPISVMAQNDGAGQFFGGRCFGLIIRGASSTATEISNTETWLNGKTAAY